MKARKPARQARVSAAIEDTPEGRTNGPAPATLDQIATVAGVPPANRASFKEELLLVLNEAQRKSPRRPAKRREVISLLEGLIDALEPFLDENMSAIMARHHIAGFIPTSFESLVQHVTSPASLEEDRLRTEQIFVQLIEKVRLAKQKAELMRGRGAPPGTRQGSELDSVLEFLVGRAKAWGGHWTAYKDHSDGSAKGTLVQVLHLLQPHLRLPHNDRTLLKVIDRARKGLGFAGTSLRRARAVYESHQVAKATHPK
jgi:hypothetical protein